MGLRYRQRRAFQTRSSQSPEQLSPLSPTDKRAFSDPASPPLSDRPQRVVSRFTSCFASVLPSRTL
jgi:hypothetical protein